MVEVHLIRINVRQFASERKGRTQLGAALRAVLSVRVHVGEVVQWKKKTYFWIRSERRTGTPRARCKSRPARYSSHRPPVPAGRWTWARWRRAGSIRAARTRSRRRKVKNHPDSIGARSLAAARDIRQAVRTRSARDSWPGRGLSIAVSGRRMSFRLRGRVARRRWWGASGPRYCCRTFRFPRWCVLERGVFLFVRECLLE